MIFYFTGTGNSLWVAKALSEALGETLISIADELHKKEVGLVYPVRPDEKDIVRLSCAFVGTGGACYTLYSRLTLNGYAGQPVYSVSTCGDECGYNGSADRESVRGKERCHLRLHTLSLCRTTISCCLVSM